MQPVKGTSNAGCVNPPAYGEEAVLCDFEAEENVSKHALHLISSADQNHILDYKQNIFSVFCFVSAITFQVNYEIL
jgi:hypothetical protein